MSYHVWNVYGFGFCVDAIETTPEKLLKLAALDEQTLLDVENYLNECFEDGYKIEDLTMNDFDDLQGDYGERGIAYVLYQVIKEFPITYADDFDGTQYILYCPSWPWNLTKNEVDLTPDKIEAVFEKYIEILTDEYIDIDFRSVENGG